MGCRKKIKMDCMNEDDAWSLFEANAGEEAIRGNTQISTLARQVITRSISVYIWDLLISNCLIFFANTNHYLGFAQIVPYYSAFSGFSVH
jgi:hypothetical protein